MYLYCFIILILVQAGRNGSGEAFQNTLCNVDMQVMRVADLNRDLGTC